MTSCTMVNWNQNPISDAVEKVFKELSSGARLFGFKCSPHTDNMTFIILMSYFSHLCLLIFLLHRVDVKITLVNIGKELRMALPTLIIQ